MSESLTQGRGRRWAYAAAWLPVVTIYVAAFIASSVPLGYAVRGALVNVLPDALLGLLVLRLPGRLPWPEGRKARAFATHLGLLIAFVLASAAGWLALVAFDQLLFTGSVKRIDLRFFPYRILNDLLIYCTLAGLAYAWHYAASSREQAARAARAETLRARAELEALRSQLNPHFILNTFHALVGLVRREPAVAEAALERLGDLLRYSLRIQREGVDEVQLRDEWSFVQSYLDLERLRLGDRLRVSFEATEATLDCIVPSFALQTLVENAIRHAIAPRAEGGHLLISAHQAEGRLRIQVEDEGPGVSAQPPAESHRLGLRLLQERLAALYGGQASLNLHAAAGGVRAVLELPVQSPLEEP
ncbi:MAG TPA: histidine kinase [Thermoanaerobaculia bacterium]|jgi:sensor histidine kinase YesM|nr:histidine kinase [Thermoanaerobaculia bacterium]